ncbi:class F sortase [Actinomycetospora cinnamomea]|uniref:Sortase family protein n=1 Tax=Actinomycetospora cinnamomea TaxID=663609 RepID=A0A2U1F7N7_9PSEU|nr:class F sortase [Actinomycetospora cinnamomea]PVZ08182.1 sortase family protein [Actinomycetospora cinnamomea]
MPSLGVAAPVRPVAVHVDGSLQVPDDPQVLGWWLAGAHPGDSSGAVVVVGHVDSRRYGPGALFRLAHTLPGDVAVVFAAGEARFRYFVREVRRYPKAALPPHLFDPTGPPRLVIITCGGEFDRTTRQYADNTVVTATPG